MSKENFPEDIVTSVLYQIGEDVRIKTNQQFTNLFDETAKKVGGKFLIFIKHPYYKYSKTLDETINKLILGGCIKREGISENIKATPSLCGFYGKETFQSLDEYTQEIVLELARKIRETYSTKG